MSGVSTRTSTAAPPRSFRPTIELQGSSTRVLVEQTTAVSPDLLGESVGRLSASELRDLAMRSCASRCRPVPAQAAGRDPGTPYPGRLACARGRVSSRTTPTEPETARPAYAFDVLETTAVSPLRTSGRPQPNDQGFGHAWVEPRSFSGRLDRRTEVCDRCAVALRLTTDTGERHILETPDGMTDAEAVHDLIRRTWLGASGWAQTSSGMVNLDHVVRIEAAGVSESSAAIADDERDVQAPAADPREARGRWSRIRDRA